MGFQCDSCRKRFNGEPHVSISGRQLCEGCNDQLLGMTTGAVLGGIPGGISTSGWFGRVKELRRKRRRDQL